MGYCIVHTILFFGSRACPSVRPRASIAMKLLLCISCNFSCGDENDFFNHRCTLCLKCGKNLKTRRTLLAHLKIHENESYCCTRCNKSYRHKRGLREHQRLIHQIGGINTLVCRWCDREFIDNSHRVAHEQIHATEKTFVCVCLKRFKTNASINMHIKYMNEVHPTDQHHRPN